MIVRELGRSPLFFFNLCKISETTIRSKNYISHSFDRFVSDFFFFSPSFTRSRIEVGFLHVSIPRSLVIDPLIGTMKCWEQSELDRGTRGSLSIEQFHGEIRA